LDPKPGLRFEISVSQTVIPDVIMTPIPDGGWRVELNAETLPRVLVNNQYYAELTAPGGSKEQKYFVAEKFQTATWLVRALEQRATTILKASTALVGKQDAFFRKGVQYLKPLILRDIAELTGLHESTISRVTTNKFMSTPRGIYELKYFFSQGIARTDGGEATSAEAVRHRIRQLIDDESVDAILSDDRIAELLRKYGTMVARRTVAKYREKLKIPSSVQRRRQKNSTL
jgi:RNA polymerase sigma-54 factor